MLSLIPWSYCSTTIRIVIGSVDPPVVHLREDRGATLLEGGSPHGVGPHAAPRRPGTSELTL